jgi:hypothetical protein
MDQGVGVWPNRDIGQDERFAVPTSLAGDSICSIGDDTEQIGKLSSCAGAGRKVGAMIQKLIQSGYTGSDDAAGTG